MCTYIDQSTILLYKLDTRRCSSITLLKFAKACSTFPAHFLDEPESHIALEEGGVAHVEEKGEGNTPARTKQPATTEAGSTERAS